MYLRECPFCGDIAEIRQAKSSSGVSVFVKCKTCGAQTKRKRVKDYMKKDEMNDHPAVKDVVRLWNSGIARISEYRVR